MRRISKPGAGKGWAYARWSDDERFIATSAFPDGSNADVLALADQIITAQQGEITEMQALLQG